MCLVFHLNLNVLYTVQELIKLIDTYLFEKDDIWKIKCSSRGFFAANLSVFILHPRKAKLKLNYIYFFANLMITASLISEGAFD